MNTKVKWEKFKDPNLAKKYIKKIKEITPPGIKLMEVCGTHTMNISSLGLRKIFAPEIDFVSGPGCPVCVTDTWEIDKAIDLAEKENIIMTTFGDMMKIPGSKENLLEKRGTGSDIRIIYSPSDALEIAKMNPEKEVVFIGVGFETTTPAVLVALQKAEKEKIENFSLLALHKTTPPAVKALLEDKDFAIDGFLLPGHVCSITGSKEWDFIAKKYHLPAVIAGFELLDLLVAIYSIVSNIKESRPKVSNEYKRVVKDEPNMFAYVLMEKFLEVTEGFWRGIGCIKDSGFKLKAKYSQFDATLKFNLTVKSKRKCNNNCLCGEILKGKIKPFDCPLFGLDCQPHQPVGPCMVSTEGACAAYYSYEREANI